MKACILPLLLVAIFLIFVGETTAHPALAIVADDKNQVYVSDLEKIWKIDAQGRVSVFVGKEQMSSIVPEMMLFGLAIDAENKVYTSDHNNKKTLKIAPDRKISVVFQSEPSCSPTGVYHKNKNLYVLEYETVPSNLNPVVRVQRITADGKVQTLAKSAKTKPPRRAFRFPAMKTSRANKRTKRACLSVWRSRLVY
ncbi:MAG TPA: hypothetical protein VF692_06565 [Pyrinomonadaceae bacterium]|jgi:hypothetical protein